jgi:putative DNA primase/helicase
VWVNYDDIHQQITALGLQVSAIEIGTARPVRCRVDGMGREKRGWYWLSDITLESGDRAIIGAAGVYQGADNGKVKLELNIEGGKLTSAQREAINAKLREDQKRLKAIREGEIKRAAAIAAAAWRKCRTEGSSDYLDRKGVKGHGVRYSPSGAMAIPFCDATGAIYGLQIIRGRKRQKGELEKENWPTGLSKVGHYHLIGGSPRSLIIIAEGYATAASIYEATATPVAVAFDANNLVEVAKALSKAYPRTKILVAGDDDYLWRCIAKNVEGDRCETLNLHTSATCRTCGGKRHHGNTGAIAAEAAALAVGGSWLLPHFSHDRPIDRKGATDFNDLHSTEGAQAVRGQIESHLSGLGWEGVGSAVVSAVATGGGGASGGEGGAHRPRAEAVMMLDDIVERFIPIDDGSGKYVWDTWTRKVALRDQMIIMLPAGVRGDDIKRHPVWMARGACYIDEIGFDPSGKDPSVKLNTWRGWPRTPKGTADQCLYIRETLYWLCGAEDSRHEVYQWLLCWLAYPLQHPGAKMASAVIMHGPQGTGKSTVFQVVAKIYGDYATTLNQRGLEDRFNSDWIDSKLFVLAEEVVARAEMYHIKNELKELVTGEYVRINPKNVAAYRQKNQINIVYLSNENQPLPLDNDDRRHLVVYTPPPQPEEYYDALHIEIANGGIDAFYKYLLDLDLSGFHPAKRPPMTQAKKALINISKSSELRFIDDWIGGETIYPVVPCLATDLYTAYLRWCRANGENRPRASNMFHATVGRIAGWEKKKARVYESTHYTGQTTPKPIVIPAISALQHHGKEKPAEKSEAQWLTDSVFAFNAALNSEVAR